ncbi:MAG: integrin alpha [bacterium]
MKKLRFLLLSVFFIFTACNSSGKNRSVDVQNDDDSSDFSTVGDFYDNTAYDDEVFHDEDSVMKEYYQTGGIVAFTEIGEENPSFSDVLLGQGGFFGIKIFDINGSDFFAVSAIHEADPPYDMEKPSGAVYFFEKEPFPKNLEDAFLVLHHPDGKLHSGFGYAVAGPCDINGDGFDDIVISSHLSTVEGVFAAGEFFVFYGEDSSEKFDPETYSVSHLSKDLIRERDVMSQSLVCGDIDGDGFFDVIAGGQNAGEDLDPGSTGLVAVFKGGESGLSENEEYTIAPLLKEWKQYFGASLVLDDFNGDGVKDLAVGSWGLKKTEDAVNTGGVLIYDGTEGFDNTAPAAELFPDSEKELRFGAVLRIVNTSSGIYLGVLAPEESGKGAIYLYETASGDFFPGKEDHLKLEPTAGATGGTSLTDFDYCDNWGDEGALIAGSKHGMDTGMAVVFSQKEGGSLFEKTYNLRPNILLSGDGFGSSVTAIKNSETGVCEGVLFGIPEHIEAYDTH